ncbi:aminomethyl transferase family protein [Streptomyces sp. NBC_00582]|uniref:aminomethyl transferase family protein n=1 Tax=Streptomyces sp. NBC_00582 TaxID=2975783 RepID=UPI002E7FE0C7|nr:aminomethyl transferase family protein [Streptomyces sp. NBC_00582]WUB67528.1 aminomethyl transferase family protein [Streptomyces sp. NBC_00582]
MSQESVEQAIERAGSAVELLRNSPIRPHTFPVRAEFTNWRTEQRAWRDSVALLDQSHHMTDLYIQGPDALRLLSDLGVNSFADFGPGRAKQYVAVNHDGQLIGDAVLFHLEQGVFDLVGHPPVLDWVQYNVETGDYDATTERDDNSYDRVSGPPKVYRYELQGPNALALLEKVTGAPVPETRFFHMATFTIAGHQVRGLRHGMAGQPGFELFGPWEEGEAVREAILAKGEAFDLVQVGAKAYSTANLESAWVPAPMPAVFSGEKMKGYREWLKTPAMGSLGGSMDSPNIEDYYLTPYDIGYGSIVKFDHDFVGREALAKTAQNPPRTKVTLVWNEEDVARAIGSLYQSDELPAKFIEFPKARYALHQSDKVLLDGELVGISMDVGYIANERAMVSLATLDRVHSEPGTQVTVVWGESPNSAKPGVEAHRQTEIRATVAPAPYVRFARETYRNK